ncbi:MAG: hypothetical protein ACK57U_16345 [Planctomycetota bacterium]
MPLAMPLALRCRLPCDAACLAMPLALRCRLPCDAADDVPIGREISHRICTFGGEFAYLMASLPI